MTTASRTITICGGILLGTGLLLYLSFRGITAPASTPAILPATQVESKEDARTRQLQRGAYLMTVMDCQACHTPKGPDAKPIPGMTLAGHPASAPLPEWDPSLLQRNILAKGVLELPG